MFKSLTAFVVLLFIVGTASAEWVNKSVTEHDDWDGTLTVTLSLVKDRLKNGDIIALALGRVRGRRNEDAQWADIVLRCSNSTDNLNCYNGFRGCELGFRWKFDGVEDQEPLYFIRKLSSKDLCIFRVTDSARVARVWKKVQKHDELKIRVKNYYSDTIIGENTFNIRRKPKYKFDIHIPFFQDYTGGPGVEGGRRYKSLLLEAMDD